MLCVRVLQAAMVYINTLMLHEIIHQSAWADRLTAEDRRELTLLVWAHVVPRGEIRLDRRELLE